MAASRRLSLDIDQEAGAAYLRFSDEPVARTVEFSDVIVVDLDQHNVVVGVELLDLSESVPLDSLVEKFHVHTESFAVLMQSLRYSTTSHSVRSETAVVAHGTVRAQQVSTLTTA